MKGLTFYVVGKIQDENGAGLRDNYPDGIFSERDHVFVKCEMSFGQNGTAEAEPAVPVEVVKDYRPFWELRVSAKEPVVLMSVWRMEEAGEQRSYIPRPYNGRRRITHIRRNAAVVAASPNEDGTYRVEVFRPRVAVCRHNPGLVGTRCKRYADVSPDVSDEELREKLAGFDWLAPQVRKLLEVAEAPQEQ